MWYIEEKNKKRTFKEWITIFIIRFFTNLFVLLCLVGAGTGIYFTIRLSLERVSTDQFSYYGYCLLLFLDHNWAANN